MANIFDFKYNFFQQFVITRIWRYCESNTNILYQTVQTLIQKCTCLSFILFIVKINFIKWNNQEKVFITIILLKSLLPTIILIVGSLVNTWLHYKSRQCPLFSDIGKVKLHWQWSLYRYWRFSWRANICKSVFGDEKWKMRGKYTRKGVAIILLHDWLVIIYCVVLKTHYVTKVSVFHK